MREVRPEELITALYDAWSRGDRDAFVALVHPQAEISLPRRLLKDGSPYRGLKGAEHLWEDARKIWDRFEIESCEVQPVGSLLILAAHARCTPHGEGSPMDYDGLWVAELRDGKLAYWCPYLEQLTSIYRRVVGSTPPRLQRLFRWGVRQMLGLPFLWAVRQDPARGLLFGLEPTEFWEEITDLLNFFVGQLIMVLKGKRWHEADTRFGSAILVAIAVLAPVVVGALFPQLFGDPVAYPVALLVAGAVILWPGRLAELRDRSRVSGTGYPKRLRRWMWWFEVSFIVVAAALIVLWASDAATAAHVKPVHHPVPSKHPLGLAIAWGVGAASLGDLFTGFACLNTVIKTAKERPT